jgi:hypothetical protein
LPLSFNTAVVQNHSHHGHITSIQGEREFHPTPANRVNVLEGELLGHDDQQLR